MSQNIYDHADFFAGYSQLPRQRHGLDGAPEWPAVRQLMPELKGMRALDLGCGFGWVSRWMREQGATSVLGLDLSENMIRRARADTQDDAITFAIADLNNLTLPAGQFDFVFSSLAFHYVRDFARLMRVLYAVVVPGAGMVFTIEYPIFMAGQSPKWIDDGKGGRIWPVSHYAHEGERRTDWLVEGVIKYHRMLGTTLNDLICAGFTIRAVHEFAPTVQQIDQRPDLQEETHRPMMVMIAVTR